MKKTLLLTVMFALVTTLGFSQSDKFWSANNESRASITTDKAVARLTFPKEFKLFNLNLASLRQELFSVTGNNIKHSTVISLPNAEGKMEQFEVFEASNFEPALQAKFPEIRAFSGKGITDRSATLKMSISPQGIQTLLFRTEKENECIEAYSKDHNVYAVFKSHRELGKLPWTCSTQDQDMAAGLDKTIASTNTNITGSSAGQLKTMRLAQSCNGEYSNFFGATSSAQVALVLAAFNATLTRCNGCYEKDLALHLNLIATTTNVIYYDPATDPYTTLANWNNQLQAALTANIGEANYDIGHMFGASGGGGNAGCIGCVCVDGQKGRGITSPADGIPQGDNFDIDYVAHEVGHQLGGNHTFSHGLEGTGVNKEVGSGITIMGYAGITSYDVAPHSIDIFHEATIDQIQTNLAGKTCPITTSLAGTNATPVVVPVSNYTIPISTPFMLTGTATDANAGDVLTYCWEQNDNATTSGANSPASPGKLTGPNWLSFPATTSGSRSMPRLSTILAGLFVTPVLPGGDAAANIEALSSVGRILNFRMTVRDNSAYSSTAPIKVGQTAFTDMVVTVTPTSGPFKVTSPNTAVTYAGGSSQTITWDVANSTLAPVSCANVKISMSTDGGVTFPTVLIASTANDGTESVTIPSSPTTTARIKIESIGNIFFDINDANFTISGAASPTFAFTAPAPTSVTCGTATAAITLATTTSGGFSTPINLVATGNPAGTTVTYSVNPVTPGNSTVVTLNNVNTLAPGTYNVTITGTAGAEVKTVSLQYIVTAGSGPAITAQPTNQSACLGANATFSVTSPSATGYQWQVSTNGGGTWTNVPTGGTSATYTVTGVTAAMNGYQYRVIVTGLCGTTTSAVATLTINTAPAITSQPVASTICATFGTSFTVAATGTNLTYQWQVTTDGGATWSNVVNAAPYSGTTTATLTINPVTTAMANYCYRAVVSGTCAPAVTSNSACLTVVVPASVTAQPVNASICSGGTITFSVTAANATVYKWQESTDGGATWTTLTNTAPYSGVNTSTLTITNVPASFATPVRRYRVLVSNANCTVEIPSSAATLTITPRPTAVLTAAPSNQIYPGQTTTLTAAITNGTPGTIITWYMNGVVIPGQTTTSYVVDVDHLGAYQVRVSDPTGTCFSLSNIDTVSAAPNNRLFITPNPNKGIFQVRYYSSYTNFGFLRTVTLYDSKGSKIYSRPIPVTGAYGPLNIDIRKNGKGIYFLVLGDHLGKPMAKGKVIVE